MKRGRVASNTMSTSPKTIVLASRNRKKLQEMAALVAAAGLELLSAADMPGVPDVEETGASFAENAALKASAVARATGRWALGDDSGLEVDALRGEPGIYSSRYAGPDSTDSDNNTKLLEQLAEVPEPQRTAQFVCHLAVADPQGDIRLQLAGACRGRIVSQLRGASGFGYDPLFLIPEYHRTFGELSPAVKSVLSHRARAFERLVPKLAALLNCDC
jgi:XTP/dITP diphosphohydrolase